MIISLSHTLTIQNLSDIGHFECVQITRYLCFQWSELEQLCALYRDVKQSSIIRTSNKTFEFGFVFRPFNIRLLTVFYWMPLFVFDHDCVDRSVRYAYTVRTVLLWCPLPWSRRAVFAGRGWEPWVARARRGWPPSPRRHNVGGHACEAATMRSCHPLSASLWVYSWRWREGAVRAGMAYGVETESFHDHRYAGTVIVCWSLLIPEKDRYAG